MSYDDGTALTTAGRQKRQLRGHRGVCVCVCHMHVQGQIHGFAKDSRCRIMSIPSHRDALQVGTMSCQLAQFRIYREAQPNPMELLRCNNQPSLGAAARDARHHSSFRALLKPDRGNISKGVFFLQLECKWCICPWFVIIFLTSDTEVHFLFNSITPWTVHIQYGNLCNVI